jgi:hypothetical protein
MLGVVAAPGDDDATVAEVRRLLGLKPGVFDEGLRIRWRGWCASNRLPVSDWVTRGQLESLRKVRHV